MIVVRRTYMPRAGEGGRMLALIREAGAAMKAAGFPEVRVLRGWSGDHGTIFTEQRWKSIADYEASREAVRRTQAITTVFEKIYPTLQKTHNTEILEEL
jgi:hypothetical protein